MIFSSVIFLFYFLPIVLIAYFAVKKELQNVLLLLASLFFYAWGEPGFVIVLLLSIFVNYAVGMGIDYFRGQMIANGILCFGIVANLGILFYYKYIDFFIVNFNRLSNYSGGGYSVKYRFSTLADRAFFFYLSGIVLCD